MAGPSLTPITDTAPYTNVVGVLIVPQLVVSAVAAFYLRVELMWVAGCTPSCDYATAARAEVGLWIALAVITVLTLVALIVWRRRGWKTWPVALSGTLLSILVTYIADQVLLNALSVV